MADNVKFKCSSCGASADEGSKFCSVCGSPVVAIQNEEPAATPAEEPYVYDYTNVTEPQADENNEVFYADATENADQTAANDATDDAAQTAADAGFYYQGTEENAPPAKKQNFFKKHLKLICIIGIAAILIAAAIVACVFIFGGSSNYVKVKEDIRLFKVYDDNKIVILVGDSAYEERLDASEGARIRATSLDGETVLIATSKDVLYIFDGDLKKITDDASAYKMSADGSAVAYIEDDTLYFYDGGDSEKITDELYSNSSNYFCISSDGKYVAFTNEDKELMLYDGGEPEVIVEDDAMAVGVSDGADLVYYIDEDSKLHVIKGGDDIKLGSCSGVYFNADLTQAVYLNSGGDVYIYDNGDEGIKVTSNGFRELFEIYGHVSSSFENVAILPLKSFVGVYFTDGEGNLLYVDSNFEDQKVAKKVSSFKNAKDSDVVYYETEEKLYRVESYDDEPVCLAKNINYYYITSDGDACYYFDDEGVLFYVEGDGEAVKISDDEIGDFKMTYDDYFIFSVDDKLYYSHNGSEKKEIEGIGSSEAFDLASGYSNTYLEVCKDDDEYDLYVASSGVDFKLVLRGIDG